MKQLKSIVVCVLFAATTTLAQAADTKVEGYVDAGFSWSKTKDVAATHTFGVNEGAVEWSHSMDKAMFMLDLSVEGKDNDGLSVATEKTQAYFGYGYDFGLGWKMGQFDSIYGFENNNSNKIHFADHGLVKSFTPNTFTGVLLNYDFSKMMGLDVLFANPSGDGKKAAAEKYATGARFRLAMDMLRFSAALQSHNGAMLIDAIAGTNLGTIAVDFEFLMSKPKTGDTGTAFGLHAFCSQLKAGARVEMASKMSAYSQLTATVGPELWMTKALVVKPNFMYASTKVTDGADAVTSMGAMLNGVYNF